MSDLIPYGEQFKKIVDIIESAKERAYRKVNEELILMYRDIGEYISMQSEKAEYGDAFVQKLADFFAMNNILQGQRKSVNAVDTIEPVKSFENNVGFDLDTSKGIKTAH